ncbi:MAG: hypothetical protein ACYC7L_00260 [Nitrospirota bacterium]
MLSGSAVIPERLYREARAGACDHAIKISLLDFPVPKPCKLIALYPSLDKPERKAKSYGVSRKARKRQEKQERVLFINIKEEVLIYFATFARFARNIFAVLSRFS